MLLGTIFHILILSAGFVLHYFFPQVPHWIVYACGFLSWGVSMGLNKKFTLGINIFLHLVSCVALGLLFDLDKPLYPLFTLVSTSTILTTGVRMVFFSRLGYIKFPAIEYSGLVLTVASYVAANILNGNHWESWVFLGIPVLVVIGFNVGNIKELAMWKSNAAKELGVSVGSKAPDFELKDDRNEDFKLSAFFGLHPTLLLFVRGDWCPSCHIMLRLYERNNDQFKKRNVTIVAIGPDPQGVNKEMVEKLSLNYRILSDDKQEALKLYGITYKNHGDTYEVGSPLPASILIDKLGVIRHICRADRAGEFLNPMQIFATLEKIDQ